MRASKRIGSVVLAGTLALTMGLGSVAMADQAAAPADETASAAGAAQVDEAAVSAQFKTYTSNGFKFLGIESWLTESVAGDEETYSFYGGSYDGDTVIEVSTVAEPYEGILDMYGELIYEELEAEGAADLYTDQHDYIIDGVKYRTVAYSMTQEGVQVQGEFTVVEAPDAFAAIMSVTSNPGDAWILRQIHGSFAYVGQSGEAQQAEKADKGAEGAEGAESFSPVATTEAATAEPAASTEPAAAASEGVTLELPKWTIVAHPEQSQLVFATISEDAWDSDYAGKAVIGIPISVTNKSGESADPYWDLSFEFYGVNGVSQSLYPNSYFDDSLYNVGNMRNNATADCYFYVMDEGDGTYYVEFYQYDDNFNRVTEEIEVVVSR